MKLSIVIVNYNVKYFLEQCLNSVRRAVKDIDAEVYVVDNNSVDNSVSMIREKFHEVKIIENKVNLGFSKANNQAIEISQGEYVLLLNPDTVLEDDTLIKVVGFMDEHPDAGGLGVKMIDGKGKFLPESKRGLPTPDVAFYKIFGLSKFFPKSKVFGKYHLGFLDKDQVHEVDVLSGAFMLLRKSVLDKIGLLDEAFFMYGEDIDLSYRITKAGYKNYYYPETRIIHYKGESTKKGSVNYVVVFYNAMIIFARKHFSHKNARTFSFLINSAIYFRAFLAILNRFFKAALFPVLDIILLYSGIFFISKYWGENVIFRGSGNYPVEFTTVVISVYIIIWLLSTYFSGGYDKPIRLLRVFLGVVFGTFIILLGYALLPETLRFSRAIILLGAAWGGVSMMGSRILLNYAGLKEARLETGKNRKFIIIGDQYEAPRVAERLKSSNIDAGFIGLVNSDTGAGNLSGFIGNISQIREIIDIYKIDELIFCAKNLPHNLIIDLMTDLQHTRVDYKIAPEDTLSIIGSNSINTAGDLYAVQMNAITSQSNKRNKRLLDIVICLIMLVTIPINIFVVKNPMGLMRNIVGVLVGRWTWVGYHYASGSLHERFPLIRKGILTPAEVFKTAKISNETAEQLNYIYARDYHTLTDLNILLKGWRNTGRFAR